MIVLDEVNHRAFLENRELVRVTSAFAETGLIDCKWFTEESRLRGIYLHAAVALYHEGALDEQTIDPMLDPYWAGYRAFLAESAFTPIQVEQPIFDALHGYAGRFDLWGSFEKLPPSATDLIDIKTGKAQRWVQIQTMPRLGRFKERHAALPQRAGHLERVDPEPHPTERGMGVRVWTDLTQREVNRELQAWFTFLGFLTTVDFRFEVTD